MYRVLTGWLSWRRQPLLVGEEGRLGLRLLSGRCKIGRVGRSRGPLPGLVQRVWNRMMLPVALQGWGKEQELELGAGVKARRAVHLVQRRRQLPSHKRLRRGESAEGYMVGAGQEKLHGTLLKRPRIG